MCLQCEGKVLGEEWIDDQEDNQENWVLAHVQHSEQQKETFAQQIRRKEGVVVSDKSYKLGRSSAIFTTVPEKKIKGVTTIPGNKKDQSSYRGELGGILAGITYTNKVVREKGIMQGKCTAVCYNKGAIKAVFGGRNINPRWKCFKLLTLIHYQIKTSPIKWEGLHVKGHQDKETPYEELPVMAQANVDVDKLAKEELQRHREVVDSRVPGQIWRLYDKEGNQWISGDIEKEIRRVIYEKEMRAWWTKRIKEKISNTEWEEFKRLNRMVSNKDHFFAVKYGTGIIGKKLNIVRRKQGECSICPCCDQEEDTDHIMVCQSQVQKEKLKDEIKDMEEELVNKTSWEIKEGLSKVIWALHEQREPQMGGNWKDQV